MLNAQEQSLHDQRVHTSGKLDFMNELQADITKNPPESPDKLFEKFETTRVQWRGQINQFGVDEQGMRDNRMQVLGAADNINYVEQTWENSARELSAQKTFIEGLENVST